MLDAAVCIAECWMWYCMLDALLDAGSHGSRCGGSAGRRIEC